MNSIFNFFGSILGYLLWLFYLLVHNYGVAIILFTVVMKVALFPFSVKQQKSMAANSKMAVKQKELQKKYAKDKQRLQLETQKLYEKEGVNPMGGCSTMFLPLLIMMGLYFALLNPLSNALHLSGDAIAKATDLLTHVPGIGGTVNGYYAQLEIVKHFSDLKPFLTMFGANELAGMEAFSRAFGFLGLNLLNTPCDPSNIFGTLFRSNLWIIPIGCLISYIATQYFTVKMQPGMQQQQGCMKFMMYGMSLFSAWISCTIPAAVGLYWIVSSITGFLQTIILNIWYGPTDLTAKAEAQRIALRELEEAQMRPALTAGSVNTEENKPNSGKRKKSR